ncbi:MAG: hypothetical protein WCO68_06440 [Verrucomicrobiota bacterium]
MKYLAYILALMLPIGCSRQPDQSNSVSNTIESIETLQVMDEGEPAVELTISQRVNPKAPVYVVGIRESKWENRLRWGLVHQTIGDDRVISCFHIKPVGQTNEITLNRDDFEWYPQVIGFKPVTIVFEKAKPDGAANGRQPVGSETNGL